MSPDFSDIATFSGSGRPQMRAALDHCRQGKFVGPGNEATSVSVAGLLSQETHARGDAWVDLKATAKRAGWNTMGSPAVSAHSAGAAISTRLFDWANPGRQRRHLAIGVARAIAYHVGGWDPAGWGPTYFSALVGRRGTDTHE